MNNELNTTQMNQEELIEQAVNEAVDNLSKDKLLLNSFMVAIAIEAINKYIELSNTKTSNTLQRGSIVDINDDGEVESIQEYSQSKHDCENDTTIKPQSKLDVHPNSPHLDYIKHMTDNIPQDEWASTLKSEDVEKWALTQMVDIPGTNDEGYEEFKRNQRFHEEIAGIGHDIVLKYLESKENKRHSSNNILRVTKREPNRINHLVQQHNMKVVDNMNIGTNAVTIAECDIIWNDEQWNDDHIVPYIVAISERDLDPVTDTNVGFRFTSQADMKNYLKYDSKNDFTIVRINCYYQL